jgi:hypothetical protein
MYYAITSTQGPHLVRNDDHGKVASLYHSRELALMAMANFDLSEVWIIHEMEDLLGWLVSLAQSGIHYIIEVVSTASALGPRNVQQWINELRIA